jgi:hypothetical protein
MAALIAPPRREVKARQAAFRGGVHNRALLREIPAIY